jgi:flagellar hook-basal body complex protein FliE
MSDIRIGQIQPPGTVFKPEREVGAAPAAESDVPFGKMIKNVVAEAMDAEQGAAAAVEQFASGSMNDVHDVMLAVTKANMAVQLLVQVRNGLLEAYQELSRIQV